MKYMTRVGSVNQILRVDHAGERGAISIYEAQLFVSEALKRSCISALEECWSMSAVTIKFLSRC